MSRTTSKADRSANARKVAAVHRHADKVLVVVGEASGQRVQIRAKTYAVNDWAPTPDRLAADGIGRVVNVIPGAQTVSRVVQVPLGEPNQMIAAASLLAEVQLPDSLPPHRRAAGVLGNVSDSGMVPALLVGWRGPSQENSAEEESWCSVIGSLAALRSGVKSAWHADPSDGSISVLSGAGAQTRARVAIEDNSSSVLWGESLASTVGEDLDDPDMRPRLGLSDEDVETLRERIGGESIDRRWLDTYGIALGALLISVEPGSTLSGLAAMKASAPKIQEPAVHRLATWLGVPSHAWWVTAASVAVLVLAPLGLARARLAILDSKATSLTKAKEQRKRLDERAAIYAELAGTRRPMTKLLADISQATPQGVVVRDLKLQPEVEQGVTILATAESQGKIYDFQANLNKTQLFSGAKVGSTTPKEGGVDFEISMGVANPHLRVAPAEGWDWAASPLAERLHGKGASNTEPPVHASNGSAEERPTRRTRPAEVDEPEASTSRRTAADRKDPGGVPPALTDDQIAKLDRIGAMRELATRRTYPQKNPSLDAATKRRLEDEVIKLRERMDVLRNAAGKASS